MNRRNGGLAAAAVLLFLSAMFSCTKVDNGVGDDLIPDGEKMKTVRDTLYGIHTYIAQPDSFPTGKLTNAYFGSYQDAIYGSTRASVCAQYILNYFTSGDKMFGAAPVYDSLVFSFTLVDTYLGDTTKTQKFDVYELKDPIYADSSYYADFDYRKMIGDDPKPLFSFELTNIPRDEINLRLTGPEADAFAHRLMDTSEGAYTSDSLFYSRFKGICITPAESSPANACLYKSAFTDMEFALYTRNHTDETGETVQDTVTTYYSFSNSTVLFKNGNVATFEHDYAGTPYESRINDTLPDSAPVPVGYIQTLGGLVTYVRFTDEFVEALRGRIKDPYKSMLINRATLTWDLDDPTAERMDKSILRVGAYSDYCKLDAIPDYNYNYEGQSSTALQYDGYLNRTHGTYSTDLSSFLQKLISSPKTASKVFMMGPSYDARYDFRETLLKTEDIDPPLRVIITYTLVR